MHRSTKSLLTILVFIPFILSACDSSGDPTNWRYSRRVPPPAQEAPSTINRVPQPQTSQAADPNAAAGIPSDPSIAQAPQTQTPPTNTRANLPPVKIALLLPLTGQHEALGNAMLKAAQIALFDVGHQNLKLIPQDTQGTPEGANAAARAALAEGAQLVLGPVFADSVRAARPVTSAANVNMIAFSTDWTLASANRPYGNTFIMGFLPFDQVDRLSRYIATKQVGRVGIISPQTSYGRVVTNAFNNAAARYGIVTTQNETFAPSTANLAPNIRQFVRHDERKAANDPNPPFDAVLMPVGGQQASSIANLLSHYDLPPRSVKRLGTGLFDDTSLAREPSMDGAWFAAPSPNLRRDFEQKFTSTYGQTPPRLSTLAYDATALAAVLAMRGQKADGRPDFDRTSIANPNGFAGIDGIFRFRPDGSAERGLAILEFRNGQIRIIDDAPRTFQQTGL